MADISKLGVSVDTSEVREGTTDLHKFGEESGKALNKTNALNKVMGDVARIFSMVGVSISKSNLALIQATKGATTEQIKAGQAAVEVAKGAHKESLALNELTKSWNNVYVAAAAAQKERKKQIGGGDRNAAQANRFNTGNIAAQFQDIFVTAQMGMNPLTIALQQGTQLVYILQQTKNPLKDLLAGLKNLLSPLTLIVVLITGFLAKFIQTVDWINVGKNALNSLANGFDYLANNIEILTAVSAVAFAGLAGHLLKSIISIESLKKAFTDIKTVAEVARKAIFNSWVLIPALFVGFVEVIGLFPKQTEVAVNAVIDLFVKMTNEIIGLFTAISQSIGVVVAGGVSGLLSGSLDEGIKTIKDTFRDTMETEYIKAEPIKSVAKDVIEGTSVLVKEVNDKMSNVFTNTADKLRKTAQGLGENTKETKKLKQEVDKLAESWDRLNKSANQKINDLIMQRSLIGAGTYESTYVQTLNDLTRQAENAGIDVYTKGADGKSKYEEINAMAQSTAQLTDEVQKMSDKYNFARSTVGGFFSDMRHGLRDGQSAWESFGNAVTNVLDKILDKIMDIGVDALFQAGRAGGWFGSTSSNSTAGAFNAMGGQMGVKPELAANGGVFSNGVYSSPTLFKFAKGGKFGVMGEAGPEAVMPLRRGPDGSLGVKADGVGDGSSVVVNVINNSNAQAKTQQRQTAQGIEIDVLIDEMVGEKIGKPGTSSNNALRTYNNQRLVMR